MSSSVRHLISPFDLRGLSLRNRVVLAPMTRARSGPSRVPNARMVEYYVQRSSAGLVITEGTFVSQQAIGWVDAPGTYTEEMRDGWKAVTEAVHAKGGVILMQLWHTGRASHNTFQEGGKPVAPSAIAMASEVHGADGKKYKAEVPRALETSEIPRVVDDFRAAAQFAKEAGFDGVEVHGANGYLIDEFLQSSSNKRTDQYGGSLENRFRFLDEIVQAVATVWPKNRIGVRLSPNGSFNGMGSEDNPETFTYVAEQLGKQGLLYLHVMDGLAFGYHEMAPPVTLEQLRKVTGDTPLVGNCGYTKETAEERIAAGHADLVAFGRPYLANPDLVERFANDWPLAELPDPSTWYVPLDENYIDFPPYQPAEEQQ